MNLWVVDPRQVAFLCSCKEKLPKESTPPSLRPHKRRRGYPALLAKPGPLANSPSERNSRFGLKQRERTTPGFCCGARLALGGSNNNHSRWLKSRWFVVGSPYGAALSIAGVWGEARQGSGQEVRSQSTAHGSAVDWRGPQSREAQKPFAPFGVRFLLVTFLCANKEKSLAVGQPPTSFDLLHRPRAERRTTKRTKTWISALLHRMCEFREAHGCARAVAGVSLNRGSTTHKLIHTRRSPEGRTFKKQPGFRLAPE